MSPPEPLSRPEIAFSRKLRARAPSTADARALHASDALQAGHGRLMVTVVRVSGEEIEQVHARFALAGDARDVLAARDSPRPLPGRSRLDAGPWPSREGLRVTRPRKLIMPGSIHDLSIPRNAALDLGDAELIAVGREGSSLILDVLACVHRSHGIPGTDPGAILVQPAAIILPNGQLLGPMPALPCTIAEGEIAAGGRDFDAMIPCPFSCGLATRVDLTLSSGQRLRIDADQITILFTGDPDFVDDFEGDPYRAEDPSDPLPGPIGPITGPGA